MSILFRRITISMLVTLVLVATTMLMVGAGFARAQDGPVTPMITTEAVSAVQAPAAQPSLPSMEELRARADYVSPDGLYVIMGPVEISTTPAVTRAPLD